MTDTVENTEVNNEAAEVEKAQPSLRGLIVTLTSPNGENKYKFLQYAEDRLSKFVAIDIRQITLDPNEPLVQDLGLPPEGYVSIGGPNGYQYEAQEVEILLTEEGSKGLMSILNPTQEATEATAEATNG